MRLNLRKKLMFFAIVIAIVPLAIAGRTMIRIAQDELKSSANEQLVNTAQQVDDEINDLYERTWLAPVERIATAALPSPADGSSAPIGPVPVLRALPILGTTFGLSLLLVVRRMPFLRRPSVDERISPCLRGLAGAAAPFTPAESGSLSYAVLRVMLWIGHFREPERVLR